MRVRCRDVQATVDHIRCHLRIRECGESVQSARYFSVKLRPFSRGRTALGWDVRRLQDEKFVAVELLYGLRVDGGTSNDIIEPPLEVSVRFQGLRGDEPLHVLVCSLAQSHRRPAFTYGRSK